MALSPFYRTYYKATIKTSTPVWRGYSKARHTRLSDNFITVAQLVIQIVTKVTKNHLPGFSTLASNSVIGGAKGGSLLITSDGAPANHTHYSALMALLLYHRSNKTVVFVPPNPLVTLDHDPIVDWVDAGKWTVTLEQ